MKFSYNSFKINTLLTHNNCKLKVPRYQRDYSWEKEQVCDFADDILAGITLDNKKVCASNYFFGTILLAGNMASSCPELEIIDGQQRITTMTIFLSVLAKKFYSIEEEELGNVIWRYIMGKDYDGREYRILISDTVNNYFEYLVQMKGSTDKVPIDEEQDKIKYAYDYFNELLYETTLRKRLRVANGNDYSEVDYLDLLKAIRTQLLDSDIICISTEDKESSNLIFEILNGKGKKLDAIDLIKNTIFERLNTQEPTDDTYNIWKEIKSNLLLDGERIEFQTFYRHYWLSKYKKVKDEQLYIEFNKTINEEEYKDFIEDIKVSSKLYSQIVWPNLRDYSNREEYKCIVEYLNYLNDYLKISQVRIAILAIFDAKFERKVITYKKFKTILEYTHQFHFAYIALCSKKANALESKYSKFAIRLTNASDKNEANQIIDQFQRDLDEIFPDYNEFKNKFISLEYSSKNRNPKNMLSKYILKNIEKFYSSEDVSKDGGSIEHIAGENGGYTLNIGNLILIERKINEDAGDKLLQDKIEIYKQSKYSYIKNFIEEYTGTVIMDEDKVKERAENMAKEYYEKVLGRTIS